MSTPRRAFRRSRSLTTCLVVLGLLAGPDSATGSSVQRRTTLGCLELDGVIAPSDEFAFLCQSALLDNPIDEFLEVNARTRAGVVNPRAAKNLLSLGRCVFSPAEFASLDALRLLDERDIIDSISGKKIGTDFGFGELNGVARAARSVAALDPSRALAIHTFLSNLVGKSGVPYFETLNGLGFDPNDPSTVLAQDGFKELLDVRPDRDRAHDLSSPGFDALSVEDTVCELALGMEEPVDNATDEPDPVTGANPSNAELAGKALFIGPDGQKGTSDELPIRMCPPGTTPETLDFADGKGQVRFAGSRCREDFPDGTPDPNGFLREPLYYLAPDPSTPNTQLLDLSGLSPAGAAAACRAVVEIEDGGLNMNGECISLSTDRRIGRFNRLLGSGQRETIAAKEFLQDPAFRPPSAILEPTNLLDLRLRAGGAFIPARPPAPSGGLIYPNAGPFSRRVDPDTGAPVNALGPLTCKHRVDPTGARLGPDGDASTRTDNDMPTVGNCLLWYNPGPGGATDDGLARQFLRSPVAVAQFHSANQELVARLCLVSFDEDSAQCSIDSLNNPTLFQAISNVLSGDTGISGVAVEGYDSVRLISDDPNVYYQELGKSVFTTDIFTPANSLRGGENFFSAQLSSEQLALLGCGSAFATSCDSGESLRIRSETPSAFLQALRLDERIRLVGGIDLENAAAPVLIQEFTLRRSTAAGSLVGDASGDRFEAGISYGAEILGPAAITPSEATALGGAATGVVRDQIAAELFRLGQISAPNVAEMEVLIEAARPPSGPCNNDECVRLGKELNLTATDFQIEPSRWIVDPTKPNLTFLSPDVGPDAVVGTSDDDYFDPVLNPTGTVNPLGENCSPFFGGPEPGCTNLEIVSANLERWLIAAEIIGLAAVLDPYETVAEFVAMGYGDPSNDLVADPISGEDGIVFNDFDRNGDGVIAHDRLDLDQKAILAIRGLAADSFDDCAANAPSAANFCWLNLDTNRPLGGTLVSIESEPRVEGERVPRLIGALPIAMRLSVGRRDVTFQIDGLCPSGDTPIEGFRDNPGSCEPRRLVPIQRLSPFELQQLETFDEVTVEGSNIGEPPGDVTLFRTFIDRRQRPNRQILTELGSLLDIDQDGGGPRAKNRVFDLDQDRDGALDFVDDGLPGPGAGGNAKCGSGIPGDVLQDAQQTDFDGVEQAKLARLQGSGLELPPRSPEFCAGLVQFLDLTGPTRDGRRAFLWQGALPEERMDRDADGDIDLNDLQEIVDARNTPAAGADDPLDLDADGQITVLDARKAALLCTRAGCADETGAAPASLEAFLSGAGPAAPTLVPALSREGLLLLSLLLLAGVGVLRRWRFRT